MVAVLRGQGAGFDLELLQHVRERERHVQIIEGIVMRSAIENVCHAVGQTARDRDGDGGEVLVGVEVAAGGRGGGAGQSDKLGWVAAIQGKLDDLLLIDDLADAVALGLDLAAPLASTTTCWVTSPTESLTLISGLVLTSRTIPFST